MPNTYPVARSLEESAKLGNQAEYAAEAERAPGGEYVVAHINDGPYYLVTVTSFKEEDADFRANGVLAAFPPIEVRINQYDEAENALLVAVPKYAKAVLEWYADGEVSYTVSEIELHPYSEPPTDRDLAIAVPALLNFDGEECEALEEACATAFDSVGIGALLTLVAGLPEAVLLDAEALHAAIDGILSAPAT